VWCRRRDDYDVLLCVANWPAARQNAWKTLLAARAIENLSYVVGVNRVGTDGKGLVYRGGSAVYDATGQAKLEVFDTEGVHTVTLEREPLDAWRSAFPAWRDADVFELS
jgi:predicted amidohydrolase